MCIRDRLNPLASFRRSEPMQLTFEVSGVLAGSAYRTEVRIVRPGGSALSRLFGGGAALRVAADGVHPGGLLAVSYTHLRAHETVLDLVCRLLLEKKNYQPMCSPVSHTAKR